MKKLSILASIICLLAATQASAVTLRTATNKATATLASNCVLTSNNLNFGTLTPAPSGFIPVTGSLNVICSKGVAYQVAISFHADGTVNSNSNYNGQGTTWQYNGINAQLMESHSRIIAGVAFGDKLIYDIFREPTYTTAFGDQQTVTGTGTGVLQTVNMYARMSMNQYVTPDTYSSNVIVVLTY